MQMIDLSITVEIFPQNIPKDGTKPLQGIVKFAGAGGVMVIPLTKNDIQDIQQLLMKKTKDLASEAGS